MTKKQAIANYTAVYAAYLNTITIGGDKNVALAFAVKDMLNQIKGLPNNTAILTIIDETDYLKGKIA